VGLWALLRQLGTQVAPLSRAPEAQPPDLQAGRLLAEVLRRLNKLPEAERTLRRITLEVADQRELVFDEPMGSEAEGRKKWIMANAKKAALDV
jgi:hypothetical protein